MISVFYLGQILLDYLIVCPVFLLLEWILCRIYRRQGIAYSRGFVIGWQLLALLLTAMFSVTGTAGVDDVIRFGTSMIQKQEIYMQLSDQLTAEMLLNVLLFIPLGVMLPLLWNNCGFLQTVGTGFLLSGLIELSQLFNFRATDINDLLMNTIGVLLGYVIFLLFFRRVTVCLADTSDTITIAGWGSCLLAFAVYALLASPSWMLFSF
ncbi:MAG: VanZ family protein [Eubacteriales bacterium]|nr:VanZ family protein [Eubacteriales bacterium]